MSMRQAQTQVPSIGIDFGTTNSTVGCATGKSQVELVAYPTRTGETFSFRSLLYLQQVKQAGRSKTHTWTGPSAIEHYLAAENKGRLIQSLKSYLSRSHPHRHRGLRPPLHPRRSHLPHPDRPAPRRGKAISAILSATPWSAAPCASSARRPTRTTPSPSPAWPGLHCAGFERVDFEMEPVAAAYAYESTLDHDELILIGDFGGGTSDFSLLHVGPACASAAAGRRISLGNSGLGLAGDAFDARIVRKLVSPARLRGSELLLRRVRPASPSPPSPPGSTPTSSAGIICPSYGPATSWRS